jgi:hypothetical protein
MDINLEIMLSRLGEGLVNRIVESREWWHAFTPAGPGLHALL